MSQKPEKKAVVQLSVSYDRIRQVMCLISGKILDDKELDELIGNEVLIIPTDILNDSQDQIEQLISTMILTQKLKEKDL
jgi:hypothetical protein